MKEQEIKAAMLAKIAGSKLTPADAAKLKFSTVTAAQAKEMRLPAAAAGFRIPYFDICGKPTKFFRVRYVEDTRKGFAALSGRKPLRYGKVGDTVNEVYMPPFISWKEYLAGSLPLMITEGELKAACATLHGVPTIGLGGVWCFMSKRTEAPLLPIFDKINLKERLVIICYDSDAVTNPDVVMAETILAKRLTERGAEVCIARIPQPANGGKMGVDDYIVAHGAKHFTKHVLDKAFPHEPNKVLHELNSSIVYVRNPGFVYDYTHDMKLAPAAFVQHSYSNLWFHETTYDKDGNTKLVKKPAAKSWLEWEFRSELRGITYAPGQSRTTEDGRLNMWRGWGVQRADKGDVSLWHKLMDHLFGQDKEARRWFERWCAYPIQHPGAKLATAVLLWGVTQGSGKTLVGHTLMRLYGDNATEVKDKDLEDERFEWAENKQFVLADDITGHNNRKLANRFKTMVTQKLIRLNIKYVPSFTVPDCINYYFTANDPDAFYLDDGDRRFFIHEVRSGKLNPELRKAFVKWRDSEEGQSSLMYYLLNLDLGEWDPQEEALKTQAKRDMTSISKSELGVWVAKLREEPDLVLNGRMKGDLFTSEELHALFDPVGDKRASANALARELRRAGFDYPASRSPLRTSSGWKRVFAVRNIEKWNSAKHAEALAHYEENRALKKPKF